MIGQLPWPAGSHNPPGQLFPDHAVKQHLLSVALYL